MKYLVTYLIADFDGRGVDRLRTGTIILTLGPNLRVAADEIIEERGFLDAAREVWVMPGAILSLRPDKKQNG